MSRISSEKIEGVRAFYGYVEMYVGSLALSLSPCLLLGNMVKGADDLWDTPSLPSISHTSHPEIAREDARNHAQRHARTKILGLTTYVTPHGEMTRGFWCYGFWWAAVRHCGLLNLTEACSRRKELQDHVLDTRSRAPQMP